MKNLELEVSDLEQAILIAGPTASGKSALALELAKKHDGVIINTDSMQVYSILKQLTARPDPSEMDGTEHILFGHIHPSQSYSVAIWLQEAQQAFENAKKCGRLPIFVGGTGLYFKTLLEGLSAVPPVDPEIRRQLRDASAINLSLLYQELQTLDPDGATRLEPGDSQRIVRALEVVKSTGKPLSWWQASEKTPGLLATEHCRKILLLPERSVLRSRIAVRFADMVENGALEEVQELLKLNLSGEMPAMRAIGVSHLARYLEGECSLEEAIELSVTGTRQYAKRQMTWFRHQFDGSWEQH